jgi:hypothetical protein
METTQFEITKVFGKNSENQTIALYRVIEWLTPQLYFEHWGELFTTKEAAEEYIKKLEG